MPRHKTTFHAKRRLHAANMRLVSKDKLRARKDRVAVLNLDLAMGRLMWSLAS